MKPAGEALVVRTGVLASVLSLAEAETALVAGADIIDLKNPAAGALGALPAQDIAAIVRLVAGRRPVSATIGDLPMHADPVCAAVERAAATGVDYIKIGMFDGGDGGGCLRALRSIARRKHLIAVLFADRQPDLGLIEHAAECGFAGVMLDTADKSGGGLRAHLSDRALAEFVASARHHRLLAGLAGKLSLPDIPLLAPIAPDYLGFRGALCSRQRRTGAIDPLAIRAVLQAVRTAVPEDRAADRGICVPTERQSQSGQSHRVK